MRPASLISLLIPGLLAAAAELLQDGDVPVGALAADEECAAAADGSASACALNALQLHAQKAAAGGEEVASEASAANSTADQESDLDDAGEPEAFVELEDSEEEGVEGESAEDQDSTEHDSGSRRRGSGRRNMCCKCYDNTVSWSASGTCSHCQRTGIFKTLPPPTKCQKGSSQWSGGQNWPKYCAQVCGGLLSHYRAPSGGSGYNPGHHNGGSGYNPGVCKTETGGSCKLFGCAKSRGKAVTCVHKKCVCSRGTCANSKGQCV